MKLHKFPSAVGHALLVLIFGLTISFSSTAMAQEQTYDGSIAKGDTSLSRTTEPDASGGYTERTYYTDANGIKKLVEIRKYRKGAGWIYHWITYTDDKGKTITEESSSTKAGGYEGTKTEVDKDGNTTTYTWSKDHWAFKSRTPKPASSGVKRAPGTPELETGALSPTAPSGNSLAMLASTGQVKIDSAGTGETIGHIADLTIQNLTDQPLAFAIPPMILESGSGKNQHYACPKGQNVALNPHQEKTVPMDGVCVDRSKPPVGKGVTGDLVINEGNPTIPQNPNSHVPPKDANKLVRLCTSKYDAADKLQKDGALKDLPYHDKQKQKDIVVQWSTWTDPQISEITGAPPATKEDLKKVVYKQVPEPMTPATKKKIDQGIDTIFEKVELTSKKAKDLEKPDPFEHVELTGEPGKGATVEETPTTEETPTSGQTYEIGMPTPKPPPPPPPCKEKEGALNKVKGLVDTAVAACRHYTAMDDAAKDAEKAADANDLANPAAKAASDQAAADARAAQAAADKAAADAKAAGDTAKATKGKGKDPADAAAKDAKDTADAKAQEAKDTGDAAEAAKSLLRKAADKARAAANRAKKTRDDALKAAREAINGLKCPENKDKYNKELKDAGCP